MFITYDDLAGLAVCGSVVALPFVILGAVPLIFLFILFVMFLVAMWAGNQ